MLPAPNLAMDLADVPPDQLTPLERRVPRLIARDYPDVGVAGELFHSRIAFETHVSSVPGKP